MQRPGLIALLLVVATLAVYAQTADFEFMGFDDSVYVYENPHLIDGVSASDVAAAFEFGRETANWHPLTMLSLTLDTAVFGLDQPGGYHAVNTALHLLGTLLLFGAMLALTGRDIESGLVAAAFALHPLHVESVAWVTERKDVLAGVFWWATTWLYVRAVRGEGSRAAYLASLACFALGLMAKPLLVTLPCTLLLLDYWPLRRRITRRVLLEKAPYFALVGFGAVMTLIAQGGAEAIAALDTFTLPERVANAAVAYVVYLRQTLWPVGLGVFYPHPYATGQVAPSALEITAAVALLTALSAGAAVAARRGQRAVLVGWLFYLGVMVPMIGIVQVGAAAYADRYMYVPLVGLTIAVFFPVGDFVRARPALWWPALCASLAVCLGWGVAAHRQAALWRDTPTLFEHTIAHTTPNVLAHHNLAHWLQQQGDLEGAKRHYRAAYEVDPAYEGPAVNLGLLIYLDGDIEAGMELLEAGVAAHPRLSRGHVNLAIALVQQGDPARAEHHLERALETRSVHGESDRRYARKLLAALVWLRGDTARAVALYQAALVEAPGDTDLLRVVAARFATLPEPDLRRQALTAARRLVELDGEHPVAALELRLIAEEANGDLPAARASLEAALALDDPRDEALRGRLESRRAQLER